MRFLVPVGITAAALLLAACAPDPDHTPGAAAVPPADHAHDEESDTVSADARRIAVTGGGFRFDPATITVAAGDDVSIALTSSDVLHDFVIDELGTHVAADAGRTEETALNTARPGAYTYYCSVPGHRAAGMEGALVVE
jgi:plastocyanin